MPKKKVARNKKSKDDSTSTTPKTADDAEFEVDTAQMNVTDVTHTTSIATSSGAGAVSIANITSGDLVELVRFQ